MSNSSDKQNPLSSATGVQSDGSAGKSTADADASSRAQHSAPGLGRIHPQTCCPNCHTVFEVSSEHLASSDTRVRCGECLSIFDALSNLQSDELLDGHNELLIDDEGNILDADGSYEDPVIDVGDDTIAAIDDTLAIGSEDQARALAGGQGDATALDVTYSDYDLFSGEAGLPDVAYFDQTQDIDNLRFDEPDGDETFSDTLFVHDMTVAESTEHDEQFGEQLSELEPSTPDTKVDFVADDERHDPVVFTYREPKEPSADSRAFEHTSPEVVGSEASFDAGAVPSREQKRSSPWLMRACLAMLIVMLTAGLYGYRSRDALLQNTSVRPWLESGCAWVGCELSPVVNLDALKVLKRAVFTHPTIDNALVIDLAFVNEAALDQPYPVLEIRLTNSNGGLVVQNNVEPADYLDDWQKDDLLATGERLDLSLTVEDPGQTATSFELQFQ